MYSFIDIDNMASSSSSSSTTTITLHDVCCVMKSRDGPAVPPRCDEAERQRVATRAERISKRDTDTVRAAERRRKIAERENSAAVPLTLAYILQGSGANGELTPEQKLLGDQLLDKMMPTVDSVSNKVTAIVHVAVQVMRVLEAYRMDGAAKKQLVLYVMARIIDSLPLEAQAKEDLFIVSYSMLAPTIDVIVDAANGILSELRTKCINWCRRKLDLPPVPAASSATAAEATTAPAAQ